MRRILIALSLSVAPSIALAETYVLPVVTARIAGETYSTTTGFRNDSNAEVECIGRYVREDGRLLTSKYVIGAKAHRVEPDTLLEARAVGSMRLECSGPLAIASRIQSSRDDGLTFAPGHVFVAAPEETALIAGAARTIRAAGDLLVLESGGERASFTVRVKDGAGTVVAEKAYELRPHSQQHLSVGAVVEEIKQARIEVKVKRGRVIVLEEARTKALVALAPQVTLEQRVAAAESRALVSAQASVPEPLLLCPFKAAPFRDPATGLCYMRDRWYDPETGTFLTPDRSGYADSSNLYAFGRNDPVNLSDPTGEAVETVWDAVSLGIGGASLYHNVRQANYGWAAVDALGIVVDTAAVLIPFVPGGAGAALKASRATGLLGRAQLIDQTVNVGQAGVQALNEYSEGNFGWGSFYAGMAGVGLRGMEASQFRFASRGVGSNLGNLRIKSLAARPATRELPSSRLFDLDTPAGGLPAGIDFEGFVYRGGSWRIHSGNLAASHRYSSPGRGALYTSLEPRTVASELRFYGVDLSTVEIPGRFVRVPNVLDLTSVRSRSQLGVSMEQIVGNDYSVTQAIGDWARARGYGGILAPTARRSTGRNLVIFGGVE